MKNIKLFIFILIISTSLVLLLMASLEVTQVQAITKLQRVNTLIIDSSRVTEAPSLTNQVPFSIKWETRIYDWDGQVPISTSLWFRHNQGLWTLAPITPSTELSGTFNFVPLDEDGYYAFTTRAYTLTATAPLTTFEGDITTTFDITPPTIVFTAPNHISATQVPLSWQITDDLAGVLTYTVEYSPTDVGNWQMIRPNPVTASIVISSFIATANTQYTFRVFAQDKLGNMHNTPFTHNMYVGPFNTYLPSILMNYYTVNIPLSNGSFEVGWEPWIKHEQLLPATREQDAIKAYPPGEYVALMGDPAYNGNGDVPIGYGSIEQTFSVPQVYFTPIITIHYYFHSQNIIRSTHTDRYLDSFEIYLNNFPTNVATPPIDNPGDNSSRYTRCIEEMGLPETDIEGLVFCYGHLDTVPEDSFVWNTVTLDLTPYKGQDVTLYLATFNRWDNWYNAYTYIDNIETNW